MLKFSILRVASAVIGAVLVVVVAALNAGHVVESASWYTSPLGIGLVGLAIGSAVAFVVMFRVWRDGRKGLALVAVVAVVCGESYGLWQSAERIITAGQQRAQKVRTAGSPYALAKEARESSIEERKDVCKRNGTLSKACEAARTRENTRLSELAKLPVPMSDTAMADTTRLPDWLVELLPALLFSFALTLLGFVLLAYGVHGSDEEQKAALPPVPAAQPEESEQVVSWVREFRKRHNRDPKIPEVQAAYPGMPKTTVWRRIKAS